MEQQHSYSYSYNYSLADAMLVSHLSTKLLIINLTMAISRCKDL